MSSTKKSLLKRLVPRKLSDFGLIAALLLVIVLMIQFAIFAIAQPVAPSIILVALMIALAFFVLISDAFEEPKDLKGGTVVIRDRKGNFKRATIEEGDWVIPYFEVASLYPASYFQSLIFLINDRGAHATIRASFDIRLSRIYDLLRFRSGEELTLCLSGLMFSVRNPINMSAGMVAERKKEIESDITVQLSNKIKADGLLRDLVIIREVSLISIEIRP